MEKQTNKKHRYIVRIVLIALLACIMVPIIINAIVCLSTSAQIISNEEAAPLAADCIIVLGAGVRNGAPSPMLQDRLDTAIALYKSGAAKKLLMSGDHGQLDYDEVGVMKEYAINNGVPSEDIFMDHAGFSTYEAVYRAKEVFKVESAIIVTQEYHLYRALYIASSFGIKAHGVSADVRPYAGQLYYDLREFLARTKDFFQCIVKPLPTYLGDALPISGNGNITND